MDGWNKERNRRQQRREKRKMDSLSPLIFCEFGYDLVQHSKLLLAYRNF